MDLYRLPLPPLGANCYLLRAGGSDKCLVLDPGGDAEEVLAKCRALGVTPAAILLTHGHFDHVGAVSELLDECPGLAVYCHEADLAEPDDQLFPLKRQLGVHHPHLIADGDVLDLFGLTVEVLHTPGHSRGSCCYRVGSALFTGDTLFRFSMGRTDLAGGDDAAMQASLRRLAALEGDLAVHPGHDGPTTLDAERSRNPYLRGVLP